MALLFVCPQCSKTVDPTASNAEMNVANKQWQHKDCARGTATAFAESETRRNYVGTD
jgi:hypothetical protein